MKNDNSNSRHNTDNQVITDISEKNKTDRMGKNLIKKKSNGKEYILQKGYTNGTIFRHNSGSIKLNSKPIHKNKSNNYINKKNTYNNTLNKEHKSNKHRRSFSKKFYSTDSKIYKQFPIYIHCKNQSHNTPKDNNSNIDNINKINTIQKNSFNNIFNYNSIYQRLNNQKNINTQHVNSNSNFTAI